MERDADILEQLREALASGDADRTARILAEESSALRSYEDDYGNSALHLAAARGDVELLTRLLELSFDMESTTNSRGETPLVYAARCGDKYHDDVNGTSSSVVEIVRLLMQAGADRRSLDDNEQMAIDFCFENEDLQSAKELWQSEQADLGEAARCIFRTPDYMHLNRPLLETFFFDDFDPDKFKRQHLKGKTVSEYRDKKGRTLLHYSAMTCNVEYTRHFLEHGCDANAKAYKAGFTPLIYAAKSTRRKWKSSVVKLLLEAGARIEAKDDEGHTALYSCAYYAFDDVASVKLVVDFAVGVNYQPQTRIMAEPLYAAARRGNIPVMRYLLERGVDPRLRYDGDIDSDPLGETIKLLYSVLEANSAEEEQQRYELVKLFLKCGADVHAHLTFILTLKLGDERVVRLFLENGLDLQCSDSRERTGLHFAARNEDIAVLELVLDALAGERDEEIAKRCEDGLTALHYAAGDFRHRNIRLLCELGADVNAADNEGNTPLLHLLQKVMSSYGQRGAEAPTTMSSIMALVQWGADLDARNKKGETALKIARDNYKLYLFMIAQKALDYVVRRGLDMSDGKTIAGHVSAFFSENLIDRKRKITTDEPNERLQECYRKLCEIYFCQLDELQRHKIYGSVALFDLLVCDRRKLAKLARYQGIGKAFLQLLPRMKKCWPTYDSMLRFRFENAQQEQRNLRLAREKLGECLPVDLEDLILDKIVVCFTRFELKKLIIA